jgi:DNA-binding LytR/AlgR family response regulator
MRGDALASELMKIDPAIPVILCTGYSQQMDQAAEAAGRSYCRSNGSLHKSAQAPDGPLFRVWGEAYG